MSGAIHGSGTLDADIVVVGGGIAGLTAALLLVEAGQRVIVLEARDAPGGRVRSIRDSQTHAYLGDLGPTWVWPMYQPVVAQWLKRLELATSAQFDTGQTILETSRDTPPVRTDFPGQEGSVRITGGPQAIIDALVARLPGGAIRPNAQVMAIEAMPDQVRVILDGDARRGGRTYAAAKVIVAIPPRVALQTISWQPALPHDLSAALMQLPTWMAPQAKVVAFYEEAFWRAQGLSGRIMSRVGPLVEVHDHCGPNGSPAALFGFVGWPHATRAELGNTMADHVSAQLTRCFGAGAPTPRDIQFQDWAADPLVCASADLQQAAAHPDVGRSIVRALHFDGKICFAAAETAAQSPGLIEGALVAGEHGARLVAATRQ